VGAGVAASLLVAFVFAHLFTRFASWDDEGYFLQAYREFLSGRLLFDEIFSLYGPLTFFLAALFAGFHASNVTHDAWRWITFPAWLLIALLLAAVVWRWTRQFTPAVVILFMTGYRLTGLSWGIGHPQLWILVAVAVLVSLGLDWISDAAMERRAMWAGGVLGAILLLKINIGVFVFIGFALAVSLHFRPRLRYWACGLLALAASALGVGLFFAGSAAAEKLFAIAYVGSLAATAGIASGRSVEQSPSPRSLAWFTAGLAGCMGLGIPGTLALGTSPKALYDAYITWPALLVNSYHNPFTDATQPMGLAISAAGLCLTLGVLWWRQRGDLPWGLIKLAVGVGLLYAFSYDSRMTLAGSLLTLWLLIVDIDESGPAYSNRLLLALLAPVFSLQLFPMAGSQVDWAVLLPITAAGVLVADGMNSVRRQSQELQLAREARFVRGAMRALLVLLMAFLFLFMGEDAVARVNRWRELPPLNLPGAHWLRLEEPDARRLTNTVKALKENCRTVLAVPGLYSLSIWSGIPPFEQRRINSWPFLWPPEDQLKELSQLRDQPKGCVLISHDVYVFFKRLAVSPGNDELILEIQRTMRPIYKGPDATLYQFPPAGESVSGATPLAR
jgi:hypothetical protein